MKSFLKTISEAYLKKYKDLSDFIFILPNKRSGKFLHHHIIKSAGNRAILSPEIMAISDFVEILGNNIVDSRIDSIFTLFESYHEILGKDVDINFERFSSWGETILNDFNDIDTQLVDPDAIFQNIKNLREIQSQFLTTELKELLKIYFGYDLLEENEEETPRGLWKSGGIFEKDADKDSAIGRFISLWAVLNPLYHKFKNKLAAKGLTTVGGSYREAVENLTKGQITPKIRDKKLIFVGFNALTRAEYEIFRILRDESLEINGNQEPLADFIWERINPLLHEENGPASRYIEYYSSADNFPEPEWIKEQLESSQADKLPEYKAIAVPSNVMQTKILKGELEKLFKELERKKDTSKGKEDASEDKEDTNEDARVAVVLPDEQLLLPLLYSLPENLKKYNITMGYPMKNSPVISFITLLKRLQLRSRKSKSDYYFMREDLVDFLGHPYSRLLFDQKNIEDFILETGQKKKTMVHKDYLKILEPEGIVVLRSISDEEDPYKVIEYIRDILRKVLKRLAEQAESLKAVKIEAIFINAYLDSLSVLEDSINDHDIKLSAKVVFQLADRLIGGETLAFKGEPLGGMQIMGLLETRSLDFDYIYILSMNDKIMPLQKRPRTFILNSIRKEFGMPPANFSENLFAYYFYRLVGNAKSVVMTYDSRTADHRRGGVSRYILQLRHLLKNGKFVEIEAKFKFEKNERTSIEIAKTEEIMDVLNKFIAHDKCGEPDEGNKDIEYITASALKNYLSCPMKFFFSNIEKYKEKEEESLTIDHITHGNIIHGVMMNLYVPEEHKKAKEEENKKLGKNKGHNIHYFFESPLEINEKLISTFLNDEKLLEDELIKQINIEHFHKTGNEVSDDLENETLIAKNNYLILIKNILRNDLKVAPFNLYGCEAQCIGVINLNNGLSINVKAYFDRLDSIMEDGSEHSVFRIVDYKTGSVKTEIPSVEDLFSEDYSYANCMQLMFYCKILKELNGKEHSGINVRNFEDFSLRPLIYNVREMENDTDGVKCFKIAKTDITNYDASASNSIASEFEEGLVNVIAEIFNPDVPFVQCEDKKKCDLCPHKFRCMVLENKTGGLKKNFKNVATPRGGEPNC